MNRHPLRSMTRSARPVVRRYGAIALATFTAAVLSTTAAAAAAVVITVSPSDGYVGGQGTSRGEIAGHYGAPPGFGRTAAELDTVADPNLATNWAGITLPSGGDNPALPVDLPFTELSALSIWAYRDSNSLDKTLPAFRLGIQYSVYFFYLELHEGDNSELTIPDNTWTQLDLTLGGEALWRMDSWSAGVLFPGQVKDVATLA